MSILGSNIKSLVRSVDLSQKEFAEKHNISETQLSKFISSRQEPTFTFLLELADVYGIDLVDFGTIKMSGESILNSNRTNINDFNFEEQETLTSEINIIKSNGEDTLRNVVLIMKVLSQLALELDANNDSLSLKLETIKNKLLVK